MVWVRNPEQEIVRLKEQVQKLEKEMLRLRASRRVLLDLVAFQDRQQRLRIGALERENRRLKNRRHNP